MRRSKSGQEASARGNFTPPPGTTPTGGIPDTAPPPPGSRFAPRNWRVPARLNAILLIPALVGLVMGGFQVKNSLDTWNEARDAESTARLVRTALVYSQDLINERDVSAAPLLRGKTDDPAVAKARETTDAAAAAFAAATKKMPDEPGLKRRLAAFHKVEPDLGPLRKNAYSSALPGVQTQEGYVTIQHPLMQFANELGLGTGNITSYGRTVYAISLAKAAVSLERSIGTQLLVAPGPGAENLGRQRVALSSYAYLERIAVEEYTSGGTQADVDALGAAQRELAAGAKTRARQDAAAAKAAGRDYTPPPAVDQMVPQLAALPSTSGAARQDLAHRGITEDSWWRANTAKFDAYRGIESKLADKAVAEASGIADDAKRSSIVTAAVVVVALLAAFILAGLMARQMGRSMRRLRTAALGIAQQRLPMLVDQLSRTDPGQVDTRVKPLPISSTDEIGEVARAFDQVHREAVRLAAEQALLRGNINAIFTNLSRRQQSLIEGQLTLITDLENNEADPEQLESLFRLDHLATRMRRNGENLLVLSGEEPGRRWDQPVPLMDVLRAATSEVEQYHRIEMSGVPEADIHGRAVTDLVHLLAELLENATSFSSPQSRVRVTATRLPDGRVMIEIHDRGIGLTAEDFADINHKLANPPTVDATVSQRMGLFVVGRLADRHGIKVQLRPAGEATAGTTSLVMLPDAITHGGGAQSAADDEFTVAPMIPQARQALPQEPERTAAELGFDDSAYGGPGRGRPEVTERAPVGRSLERGVRRAALEAQPQPQPGRDVAANGRHARDARATAPSEGQTAPGAPQGGTGHPAGPAAPYGAASQAPYDTPRAPAYGADGNGYAAQQPAPYAAAGDAAPYDEAPSRGPASAPAPAPAPYAATAAQDFMDDPLFAPLVPEAASGRGTVPDPALNGHGHPGPGAGDGTDGAAGAPGHRQEPYEARYAAPAADGAGMSQQAADGALNAVSGPDEAVPGPGSAASGAGDYDDRAGAGDGQRREGRRGMRHDPYAPVPGSAQAPVPGQDPGATASTGSGRPGPAHSNGTHELTEAGLPRRGSANGSQGGRAAAHGRPADGEGPADVPRPAAPGGPAGTVTPTSDGTSMNGHTTPGGDPDDWNSPNDERWERAGRAKDPTAGGVTPSGLPRRVPRANLVDGAAEQTPPGGPQVSRAPEDVRGRLSNLHSGVLRGRSAGTETDGRTTAEQPHGGHESTYDQER